MLFRFTDSVMDLNLHYRDFIVDDREFLFNGSPCSVPSFHDEDGNTYCAIPALQHPDPDLRVTPYLRIAGCTRLRIWPCLALWWWPVRRRTTIKVLIPDTVGPTVDVESPVDLQHLVGLSLGPATTLVRLCLQGTWLWRYARIWCCRLWVWAGVITGTKSTRFCGSGRASTAPSVRNVTV